MSVISEGLLLPDFAKRAQVYQERPGGLILIRNAIHFFGDGMGLGEVFVWLIRSDHRAGAGCVDRSVDHEIGDVDALWAKLARDGFQEDALGRLRGGEKPQLALPRVADMLPVTRIAPLLAANIPGMVCCAR